MDAVILNFKPWMHHYMRKKLPRRFYGYPDFHIVKFADHSIFDHKPGRTDIRRKTQLAVYSRSEFFPPAYLQNFLTLPEIIPHRLLYQHTAAIGKLFECFHKLIGHYCYVINRVSRSLPDRFSNRIKNKGNVKLHGQFFSFCTSAVSNTKHLKSGFFIGRKMCIAYYVTRSDYNDRRRFFWK